MILTGSLLEGHLRQVKEGNKMNQKDRINQNNQKNSFWTIMVYMAADNNLDEAALRDISEMAKAGSTDHRVNITVQLDRSVDQKTRRFLITKGGGYEKDCIETLEETNTGDPKVLEDFILWAIKNYPSKRYMLILWNHGGGWWEDPRRNIAYDDSSQGDALDNKELKQVLLNIKERIGRPIDILGMDACLMQMLEVAYQLRDCVDYMVGSEEEEPVDGWPYHLILKNLIKKPKVHPKGLSIRVVKEYIRSYRGTGEDVTQSAISLDKISTVIAPLNHLSRLLIENLEDENTLHAIKTAWRQSPRFFRNNYVDLHRFTRLLKAKSKQKEIKKAADELLRALRPGRRRFVIYHKSLGRRMRHTKGVSVYFPKWWINPRYRELDFYKDCLWGRFIESYLNMKGA